RRTERNEAPVHGEAVAPAEGHAECADGPLGGRQLAEEYVAWILIQRFLQPRRICRGPGLDSLHRSLLEREFAAIDQVPPERAERVAVLLGIAEANALAA